MNENIKILIVVGGTGGHVFPGYNLALDLIQKKFKVELISDKRGLKYLKDLKNLNLKILPSTPIIKKNIFTILLSAIIVIYSVLRSLFFLIFNRPSIIFGMGGYSSFPICLAASILKIKFVIYENNLIIGKTNKYLLPLARRVLVSHQEINGIPQKYNHKIIKIGNIIKKDIINFSNNKTDNVHFKKISILILGGSQAAKIFAEKLPKIFKDCSNQGIPLKIYQHCLPKQNEDLKLFYKANNIDFEIFNFSNNLLEYFSKVNLAITRSGSSTLAELTNAKIPFISVPLPSSAEDHQLMNATNYYKKNLSFLVEEKDLNNKLLYLIKEIYDDKSKLDIIVQNQRQFSDKNVYKNIDGVLKKILYEKN